MLSGCDSAVAAPPPPCSLVLAAVEETIAKDSTFHTSYFMDEPLKYELLI